jgi:hypothetical protein
MLRDAEIKAKDIVHNALQKKQIVANELVRIKQAEELFRDRYRTLLEGHLANIDEVKLPDDVNVLLDDSDGLVGAVEVRRSTQQPMPVYQPAASPAPQPAAAPAAPIETLELIEPAPAAPIFDYAAESEDAAAAPAQATGEVRYVDPPASGFVTSVSLGEVESPEIPAGPVELIEPGEFELPGFDMLGERERDTDIEEID